MPYTLDQFATDCRTALQDGDSPEAFEAVRQYVETALKDSDFVATHVPQDTEEPRRIIYEDPDLGFCICAHSYTLSLIHI